MNSLKLIWFEYSLQWKRSALSFLSLNRCQKVFLIELLLLKKLLFAVIIILLFLITLNRLILYGLLFALLFFFVIVTFLSFSFCCFYILIDILLLIIFLLNYLFLSIYNFSWSEIWPFGRVENSFDECTSFRFDVLFGNLWIEDFHLYFLIYLFGILLYK